jgi:hypothetical protein
MRTSTTPRRLIAIALFIVAFGIDARVASAATNAPPGTRDEFERSFHVRPGGVLKFDADLANAEIITGDTNTVRIELIQSRHGGRSERDPSKAHGRVGAG